eukprot:4356663-Ditylum_brightwellii.AAC.1
MRHTECPRLPLQGSNTQLHCPHDRGDECVRLKLPALLHLYKQTLALMPVLLPLSCKKGG